MGRTQKYKIPIWKFNYKLKDKNKKFVAIYHNQLCNEKFMKLPLNAQMLYVYMLDYSNGSMETTFPHRFYKTIMTTPTFNKCIKELIDKGFIEIKERGKFNHKPNVYKFSDKWYN
jgi:hypothetical protein